MQSARWRARASRSSRVVCMEPASDREGETFCEFKQSHTSTSSTPHHHAPRWRPAELEQRGGGEQQEGPVDGLAALQTRQRQLVEAVARLVSHSRLRTTSRLTSGTSRVSFFSQSWRWSLSARLDFTVEEQ
ncbi:hypothetical protein EYF80_029306 [Liparis tanakae]|uniref:Uncharacterized protein n=1 Tax=Liparis tanakae TaxID=230148 RepID=A0A4Z2H595_9TELE|nr:hypothetical protein EYF80_029306 [Liparis tanakae]